MDKLYFKDKLNDRYDDVIYKIYNMISEDRELNTIFGDKADRICASHCNLLICVNNEIIGFLNLVKEQIDDFLYIDMGILKEYRSRGYGMQALKLFKKQIAVKEYIIIETSKSNIKAVKILNKTATPIYEQENIWFYLLQNELKNKLLMSEKYDSFINHCNSPRNKQCLEIHKILTKTM